MLLLLDDIHKKHLELLKDLDDKSKYCITFSLSVC